MTLAAVANPAVLGARYRGPMSTKPRRLHSVPTGPDVRPGDGRDVGPEAGPQEPTDTQALMERIGQSGDARLVREAQHSQGDQHVRADQLTHHPHPPDARSFDLPPALRELLARSSPMAGSALPDLLSDIDFASPVGLNPTVLEGLAARYTWLLRRVGVDGLALTSAGYLRPVDVSAGVAELKFDTQRYGVGNREAHVRPLLTLRESAQRMGLLRKAKGRLSLTKAGTAARDDPAALVDWIASRLPLEKGSPERDAGLALLTVLAADDRPDRSIDDLVADVMSGAGWRDMDSRPISGPMAHLAAKQTSTVLIALGVLVWRPHFVGRMVTPEGAEFCRFALRRAPAGRG
jgi:hypothetical protein